MKMAPIVEETTVRGPRACWALAFADEGAIDVDTVFFGRDAEERCRAVSTLMGGWDEHGPLPALLAADGALLVGNHIDPMAAVEELAAASGLDKAAWGAAFARAPAEAP